MIVTSAIKVRPVRAEDKKYNIEVVQMINAAFRSSKSWTRDSDIVNVDRISIESLDEMIGTSGADNVLLYGFDGETVVGTVNINKTYGIISMLAVSPRYQSRGIGGLLVRETISFIKSVLKIKVAIVHVFQCKPELLEWYQRIGFEYDGEVIPFFDKSLLIIDEAPLSVLKYRIF